jgi:hypothetical protein
MNAVLDAYHGLAHALTTDPLLLLAATVATFDPFWSAFDDDCDGEEPPLDIALRVTRSAFPDIYAETVEHLRLGAVYADMDRLLCKAISAQGIPLDDLDMIGWGVPMTAYGVDLEDPEFYAVHEDLLPVLAPFGLSLAETDGYSIDILEAIYAAGRAIANSLHEQTDPVLRQVGWLYGWLFSCTGNSLVDYTDETLSEIPPLSWSKDDIAFAIEVIEEAEGIMRDVQTGLDALQTTPELLAVLEGNIDRLNRQDKQGKRHGHPLVLEWASAISSLDRATLPNPEFLQLRRDVA